MRRVTIAEIMDETGLSRATIDRVLNGRGHVHARTRTIVEECMRRLTQPAPGRGGKGPMADIVLRTGKGMMNQMRQAWEAARPDGAFHDMYQAQESELRPLIATLCADTSRPLIITIKNSEGLIGPLREARAKGKRIITLVSDLDAQARDAFVGIDDRAAGQTAAFLIGRALGDRPTTVGVVIGDTAFRCHEDREIGFRSGLRSHFPKVVLAAEARGEDNATLTREAVLKLLVEQPALSAIYNVGGGNLGVAEAIRLSGRADDILVVGHEANLVTVPLLREQRLDYVIATDPALLLHQALTLAAQEPEQGETGPSLLDFGIYTRFNIPGFAA